MSLIKKFILTALLANISEALFRSRTRKIVKEQKDSPATGLSPTPDEGQTVVDNLDAAYLERDQLQDQLLKKTEDINKLKLQLNDMIIYDWMPTVQKFCAGDVAKAKAYGFGVKGEYDGEEPSPVSVKTSFPSIVNISGYMHQQVTLEIVNSVSQEIVLPDDAKSIDIYEFIGDTLPTGDYRKTMHYVGQASRGKYTAHFTDEEVGKNVWLLAAYMPKNQADANNLFSKEKIMVI
jgi:hypothetical protein